MARYCSWCKPSHRYRDASRFARAIAALTLLRTEGRTSTFDFDFSCLSVHCIDRAALPGLELGLATLPGSPAAVCLPILGRFELLEFWKRIHSRAKLSGIEPWHRHVRAVHDVDFIEPAEVNVLGGRHE